MNTSAKPPIPIRITSLAGFAGSGIILLGCLISGLAYTGRTGESYSLLNHFISELGELRYSELALVFNL
nr:hypothetical protein [Anaerolineae bacterium]